MLAAVLAGLGASEHCDPAPCLVLLRELTATEVLKNRIYIAERFRTDLCCLVAVE